MLIVVYAAIPAALGLCTLFSGKTKVPEHYEVTGIGRIFCRNALFLYRKLFAKHIQTSLSGVERSLTLLQPRRKSVDLGEVYFVKKLSDLLMLLCAGSVLGMALYVSARQNPAVSEEGIMQRASYEEEAKDVQLIAHTKEGEVLGTYDVRVSNRRYTKEETDRLFSEASAILPEEILNGNASQEQVTTDLKLVTQLAGYPFAITWKSGDYTRIRSDGRLNLEGIPAAGEVVMLTAQYAYHDLTYEQVLHVHVRAPVPDREQLREEQMQTLLANADAATIEEAHIVLPGTFDNKDLQWKEMVKDSSPLIFLLVLIASFIVFAAKDKEVQRQMDARNNELLNGYPQFVSQLVLYLGAGMTLRSIMKKLALNYAKRFQKNGELQFLGEELLRFTYAVESGVAETGAYEQFGLRTGTREYTRLTTLLVQNVRKGSNDLLRLLEEESKKAFSERIDRARKRGEEAGTKLLMPMMLLLGIVMIIIMIPAYTAF